MILPKEFFDKVEYFEHTVGYVKSEVYDVFTLHFKAWWRPKKVIRIQRNAGAVDDNGNKLWHCTPSAGDLYNQLNEWATSTFEEKLDSITKKYDKHEHHDNVVVLKPKPKDIDE
jgi:hypothetical protein